MLALPTRRNQIASIVHAAVAIALLFSPFAIARGQHTDSTCTYARCGLSIIPRLSGLDIVRGDGETRVGSLAFLWPRDVTAGFSGNEAARSHAARATRIRRVAATMTDLGIMLAAAGAIGVVRDGGRIRGASTVGVITGIALIGGSVPAHFAADADLSRAVWRYNASFGVPQWPVGR